ncbi:MAG: hypothetical protein K0Q71_3865, partial [Thermomicrobiales bacterium]|nr:hypothetical protein [Thermomicrobiales bacterium]
GLANPGLPADEHEATPPRRGMPKMLLQLGQMRFPFEQFHGQVVIPS